MWPNQSVTACACERRVFGMLILSCAFCDPGQWVARKSVRSVTTHWGKEPPWSSSPSGSVIIWAVLRWELCSRWPWNVTIRAPLLNSQTCFPFSTKLINTLLFSLFCLDKKDFFSSTYTWSLWSVHFVSLLTSPFFLRKHSSSRSFLELWAPTSEFILWFILTVFGISALTSHFLHTQGFSTSRFLQRWPSFNRVAGFNARLSWFSPVFRL